MGTSNRPAGLIWWGSSRAGLGWLYGKSQRWFKSHQEVSQAVQQIELRDTAGLFQLASSGAGRVVVACDCRWDYPQSTVQRFLAEYPEIPLALAASDWWLGWRRTGLGHAGQLPIVGLPWFRWWDGWQPWFSGAAPAMLGPFPSSIPKARYVNDSQFEFPGDDRAKRVLIVGGCAPTVRCWTEVLGEGRSTAVVGRGCELREQTEGVYRAAGGDHADSAPDWIVWDDSSLPTTPRPDGAKEYLEVAVQDISELVRQFPKSKLWIAWSLPNWDIVHRLEQAGLQFELLAKPYLASFSSAALDRT